ncbi:DUF4435 domain-containing protein [Paracoccus marcusii]|uniref:DUF4435 domain-containing protein n=1 Tax=Paracoccus marcusii TaxID=59779 RepID=UPI002491DE23|nr:DUF4435 domain-containing protein [Paracoccus marcusii]
MFVRTNSGISNRAIFTKADLTLYVEGGGGVDGAGSSDVIFWGDVFNQLRPDIKVTILAYEGKPQLEKMADKIISGEISNTVVAMDSDFDELLGERKQHNNVLYTYGYSWENDALCRENIESSLKRILKVTTLPADKSVQIFQHLDKILAKLVAWVNADFWLRTMKSSLFPKVSPGRLVSNAVSTFEVEINYKELKKLYKKQLDGLGNTKEHPRPDVWIMSPQCFLHGHTLQWLIRCFVNYSLRMFGKKNTVNDDLLEHVMIPTFCQRLPTSVDYRSAHYRSQLEMVS